MENVCYSLRASLMPLHDIRIILIVKAQLLFAGIENMFKHESNSTIT